MRLLPPASTEPDRPAIPAIAPRTPLFVLLAAAFLAATTSIASGNSASPGRATFHRGDHARAARELSPSAKRGNARVLGRLGFRYEHGFGVPQNYDAAADLYCRGAELGDPFAQAMLGLMYDKGHGVPQDFVLAYKWLNLAAARAGGRQREAYLRFRDAVASKLSRNEIDAGQQLALGWVPGRPVREVYLSDR